MLFAATLGVAPAQTKGLPKIKGKPYSAARALLLAKGWRAEALAPGEYARCAPGREAVCEAFPETFICRGTGTASCEFIIYGPIKRSGEVATLLITTLGEDDDPCVESVKQLDEQEWEMLFDQ